MATVTNDSMNTATPTNDQLSSNSKKWSDMTKTFAEYPNTWDNPQDFNNDTMNTASPTNDSHSD